MRIANARPEPIPVYAEMSSINPVFLFRGALAKRAEAIGSLPVLERKAGRILANGFPTGVEVCHAMVHGGPFPSTSNAMFTSVGATANDRFLRPVCYQDLPAELLPAAVQDDNPLGLWRLRDGELVRK